jgi:hypothetical protein
MVRSNACGHLPHGARSRFSVDRCTVVPDATPSGRHPRMLCSLRRVGGGYNLLVRLRATFVSTHRTFLQAGTRLAYACWAKQACLILGLVVGVPAHGAPKTSLHLAANHNFDAKGNYVPGRFGFNLADVSSATQLDSLSNGAKALVWVGQCRGVDATFLKTVRPFIGRSKVFGFYLMDDPDPTGRYNPLCTPDNLRVESDWVHSNFPGAKTFILLMDLASSKAPSFIKTYNADNSHIDLFGIDPYPCRTELKDCDYDMINRYVAAAEAWGIRRSDMVPVYQVFGGGNWRTDTGGKYLLPTVSQLQQILSRWGTCLPTPVFDYVYSWGSQNADEALEGSPDLQAVFAERNNASGP